MEEKLLQKIANALIINVQNLSNPGLLNGQMGIIIFLYHYARYSSQPGYNDQADEMFDDLFRNMENGYMSRFEAELGEVGAGIIHLIKNKFVEGDPDDILHDVDEKLFNKSISDDLSVFTKGLYLLSRIDRGKTLSRFSGEIAKILDSCERLYSEKLDDPVMSLTVINSVLFFLNNLYKLEISKDRTVRILKGVIARLFQSPDLKQTNFGDCITLFKLLDQIDFQLDEIDSAKRKIRKNSITSDFSNIESQVKYLWQNLLYFDSEVPCIEKFNISEYTDQRLVNLYGDDLAVNNGLAGIGLGIIKEEMMKKDEELSLF